MKEKIKKLIYEYFKKQKYGISFVEIEKNLELNGIDINGNACIYFNKELNIIAWAGINKEIRDAILELLNEKLIDIKQTNIFIYLADGKCIDLPVVKNTRKHKNPHWLPCELELIN